MSSRHGSYERQPRFRSDQDEMWAHTARGIEVAANVLVEQEVQRRLAKVATS